MKLCVACKHHTPPWSGSSIHRCTNPRYAPISPVDGATAIAACDIQRAGFSLSSCGPEGRGFEAKPKEEL